MSRSLVIRLFSTSCSKGTFRDTKEGKEVWKRGSIVLLSALFTCLGSYWEHGHCNAHPMSLQHLQGKCTHLQSCALEEVSFAYRKHNSAPNTALASVSVPLYSPLNDMMEV